MNTPEINLWVVYEIAERTHWPENEGDYPVSQTTEHIVHVDASPGVCREAMNEYFKKKKASGDHRMTCLFEKDSLISTKSGNYNGGGYMKAYNHFEIRRAPNIWQKI